MPTDRTWARALLRVLLKIALPFTVALAALLAFLWQTLYISHRTFMPIAVDPGETVDFGPPWSLKAAYITTVAVLAVAILIGTRNLEHLKVRRAEHRRLARSAG